MTRQIEVEREYGELTWRWIARWRDEIGLLHLGLGLTRNGAVRSLRKEIEKSARQKSKVNTSLMEVNW